MPSILIPEDRDEAAKLARLLLDAAGDEPERVTIVSDGGRRAYSVDDDIYDAAVDKVEADTAAADSESSQDADDDKVDHGKTSDVPDAPEGPNAGDDDTAETPVAKPATRQSVAAKKAATKRAAPKTDGDD